MEFPRDRENDLSSSGRGRSHWTRAARGSIRTAALRMMTAESFEYENFYKASDQLWLGVAEESFRGRISRGDTAIGIR